MEGVFNHDKECQKQVTVLPTAETLNKKVKRKITHEDVLEQQYKARELTVKKKNKIRVRSVPFGTKIVFHYCISLNQFKSIKFVELKYCPVPVQQLSNRQHI